MWEMGICDLRVPLDDLADAETRSRMAELAALGHRFTAYSYGLPKGAAAQTLKIGATSGGDARGSDLAKGKLKGLVKKK